MRRLGSSFVRMLAVTTAVVGGLAVPAFASYPGGVGRIAFGIAGAEGNGNLHSVLPNGRGLPRLTKADGSDQHLLHGAGKQYVPAWQPLTWWQ